jgi:hypothetical protein
MREGPGQPAWSSRPPAHGASGRLLAGLSSANAQGTRPPSVGLVVAVLTGVSQEGGTPARGSVGRPGAARRDRAGRQRPWQVASLAFGSSFPLLGSCSKKNYDEYEMNIGIEIDCLEIDFWARTSEDAGAKWCREPLQPPLLDNRRGTSRSPSGRR